MEGQLTLNTLNPTSASSLGLARGTTPSACSHLSAEALASMLWIHRSPMLGWGAQNLWGGTPG